MEQYCKEVKHRVVRPKWSNLIKMITICTGFLLLLVCLYESKDILLSHLNSEEASTANRIAFGMIAFAVISTLIYFKKKKRPFHHHIPHNMQTSSQNVSQLLD